MIIPTEIHIPVASENVIKPTEPGSAVDTGGAGSWKELYMQLRTRKLMLCEMISSARNQRRAERTRKI